MTYIQQNIGKNKKSPKPLGILSGVSFNLKKHNRKNRGKV